MWPLFFPKLCLTPRHQKWGNEQNSPPSRPSLLCQRDGYCQPLLFLLWPASFCKAAFGEAGHGGGRRLPLLSSLSLGPPSCPSEGGSFDLSPSAAWHHCHFRDAPPFPWASNGIRLQGWGPGWGCGPSGSVPNQPCSACPTLVHLWVISMPPLNWSAFCFLSTAKPKSRGRSLPRRQKATFLSCWANVGLPSQEVKHQEGRPSVRSLE